VYSRWLSCLFLSVARASLCTEPARRLAGPRRPWRPLQTSCPPQTGWPRLPRLTLHCLAPRSEDIDRNKDGVIDLIEFHACMEVLGRRTGRPASFDQVRSHRQLAEPYFLLRFPYFSPSIASLVLGCSTEANPFPPAPQVRRTFT
jgi:hypothetical protein